MAGMELLWADRGTPAVRPGAELPAPLLRPRRRHPLHATTPPTWSARRPGRRWISASGCRRRSGVAAWRNSGPVPDHARDALQNAARVEIPTRWFVVWVVAGYLVVLVPLNWLVFMGLGRVEWAWVAAPIIALCSTVAVIRMAQLDIGFARSETELAVLELQGGYRRAHLTRYTALYTSLTTRYAFRHEDPGALVQPFRIVARRGESDTTLHYRHGNEVSLEGFVVPSNTVDMIHGEQMIDLDGPLEVMRNAQARWQVLNRTGVPLRGVGVLHRTDAGEIETAWVGELGPHANVELALRAHAAGREGTLVDRPARNGRRDERDAGAGRVQSPQADRPGRGRPATFGPASSDWSDGPTRRCPGW